MNTCSQTSVAELKYTSKKRQTRREKFLWKMEQVVPWVDIIASETRTPLSAKRSPRPATDAFESHVAYLLHATVVQLLGSLDGRRSVHITQKPEALMAEIIKICPPGGTVFDPFMGSGTTGVAALKAGLRFVGCESVLQYFETATCGVWLFLSDNFLVILCCLFCKLFAILFLKIENPPR